MCLRVVLAAALLFAVALANASLSTAGIAKLRAKHSAEAVPHVESPVVVWHGMGDTCCNPFSIGAVVKALKERYGVSVRSINTGSGDYSFLDFTSGFFGSANAEVERICGELLVDDAIKGSSQGITLIGFSQGGQFARALVQRCRHKGLNVKNLITFGGQHQGIVNVPGCTIYDDTDSFNYVCKKTADFIGFWAYRPFIRDMSVQAQYVKAYGAFDEYLKKNTFLPDINNEIPHDRQQLYKESLLALDNFVMVRFKQDSTVVPRDTAWFSWYNGTHLIPLRDQELYTEDRLGLAEMDLNGQLFFEELNGGHMQFSLQDFFKLLDFYLS